MAAAEAAARLVGWEEDSDGDDDQDGSTAALYAIEHRRRLDAEREELREQELAAYSQMVSADVDRQTMDLLKKAESTPTAKQMAERNKINLGLKTAMGVGGWRRKARRRETTHEQLVRLQKEELEAKWARVHEANELQRAMMLAMRDKAQLGPLFCVELTYEVTWCTRRSPWLRARVRVRLTLSQTLTLAVRGGVRGGRRGGAQAVPRDVRGQPLARRAVPPRLLQLPAGQRDPHAAPPREEAALPPPAPHLAHALAPARHHEHRLLPRRRRARRARGRERARRPRASAQRARHPARGRRAALVRGGQPADSP